LVVNKTDLAKAKSRPTGQSLGMMIEWTPSFDN